MLMSREILACSVTAETDGITDDVVHVPSLSDGTQNERY